MDRPQQTDAHAPNPVKVRVPVGHDTRPGESGAPVPQADERPAKKQGSRARLVRVTALSAFVLGLVALATWGLIQRNSADSDAGSDSLPKDAVALVNSTTPLPQRVSSLIMRDDVGEIDYAPDSLNWNDALREADRARQEGRYSQAIAQYSALVNSSTTAESHDAMWGLARTYEDAGYAELAIRSYSLFTYLRNDPRAARALFKIGALEDQAVRWLDAIGAYDEYSTHSGPARDTILLLKARLLGSSPDADDLYRTIIGDKPPDPDLRAGLLGLAQVEAVLSDTQATKQPSGAAARRPSGAKEAQGLYEWLAGEQVKRPRPVLDHTGDPPQVLVAQEVDLLGDHEGARNRLLDYINGPGDYAYGKYSALDALLKLDPTAIVSGTVHPMKAARIAYAARYFDSAVKFMDTLRATSNDPALRAQAALLTGKASEARDDAATAYNWYTATVQTYPASPEAPEAIRRAGDALVDQADWDAALGTFRQAIQQYPDSPETDRARLDAGVLAYRLEQPDIALDLLRPLGARDNLTPTLKAQSAFWIGKIEKAQGNQGWKADLQKVTTNTPGAYLDFRARSLLADEPDGGPTIPTFTNTVLSAASFGVHFSEEAAERQQLLSWAEGLTATHKLATTPTIQNPKSKIQNEHLDPRMASDPEVKRAVALVRLRDERDGYTAVRALAERLRDERDASGLAQLTIYLRYNADPQTAMRAAEALADLAGGDPQKLPALLLKTLYPTPYADLVMQAAKEQDIDPLVLYALMRQESEFVPYAVSGADARGLTQVIPSTGQGIADRLGDTSFRATDLYLPYVSIRYGAYYLASNLPQFDRKLLPTLAAYNGGPGNAARWLSGSALFDPDLYMERIDLFETGDYLQRVYQNYGFYQEIYEPK